LTEINFNQPLEDNTDGRYSALLKRIELKSSHSNTAVHELAHHWDMTVARGEDGWDRSETDPSMIFYRISWRLTKDPNNNHKCSAYLRPAKIRCQKWIYRHPFSPEDFARPYGTTNIKEDSATSAESYVEGTGDLSREKVRQAMHRGNFEPAAKYLFNKYVRSFDQKDGLCFEYGIGPNDSPLTLTEVKKAAKNRLKKHPNSIAKTTLTAIKEIEKEYLKNRSAFLI
jgi:hypothetical protein